MNDKHILTWQDELALLRELVKTKHEALRKVPSAFIWEGSHWNEVLDRINAILNAHVPVVANWTLEECRQRNLVTGEATLTGTAIGQCYQDRHALILHADKQAAVINIVHRTLTELAHLGHEGMIYKSTADELKRLRQLTSPG